jgi:hypothetical protein
MRGGAGSAHKGRSEADKARVQAVTDEQGHVSYEALTRPPSGDMTVIPRLYSALFDNPDYNAGQLPTVKLARSSSFQHTNGHLLQGGNAAMILALRAADEHTPAADIMASWPKPQPKIAPLEPTLVVPLMSVGGQITVRCRSKCHHLGRVPGLTAAVSGLCFAFQRTPPEKGTDPFGCTGASRSHVLPVACVPTPTAPFDHPGVDTPAERALRCCADCLGRHQPQANRDLTGDELRGRGCTDEPTSQAAPI